MILESACKGVILPQCNGVPSAARTGKHCEWIERIDRIPIQRQTTLWNKNGFSFLTLDYFWALSFEKIPKTFCPRNTTISLVPDSEVLNPWSPRRTTFLVSAPDFPLSCSSQTPKVINPIKNNSRGVTQQHHNLISIMALSCQSSSTLLVRICPSPSSPPPPGGGVNGPLTKVTCIDIQVGGTLSEIGYLYTCIWADVSCFFYTFEQ